MAAFFVKMVILLPRARACVVLCCVARARGVVVVVVIGEGMRLHIYINKLNA